MKKNTYFGTFLILLMGFFANAQDIVWTGSALNNDFFDEGNWKDSLTNVIPSANTINPSQNINLALQINNASATITGGIVQFGTGSLAIGSAKLTATSFSGGNVTINADGYIDLSSTTTPLNSTQINFTSGIGWIRTLNYDATAVSANNLAQIKVNNIASVYQTNLRLDHYYLNGCVIRANLPTTTTPLTVYDNNNLLGISGLISVNTIYSGGEIINSMNNKIQSFLLKKGFMVTFANEIDGTGKSKNYIASEDDLVINVLPTVLLNSISFIRVMPWNWVTKKGRTDRIESVSEPLKWKDLNTSWIYRWNNTYDTKLDYEYAPMSWGNGSADDAADIELYVNKYNSPYVMSFNEPDDCGGQSGQYGNLCQTDVAVTLHKNLMKTGMRVVSPGGREEAPFGWLKEFYDKAIAQDIRVDVIAVHWYDWGNVASANPETNPTGSSIFNRFKSYLTNVHNLYGLPIWITEFNANPARSNQINADFLALALPYLETLEYIERYNWFPYKIGTHFNVLTDGATATAPDIDTGVISAVGIAYRDQVSTPAIPEATVNANNSLNLANNTNVAFKKPVTASSNYLTNIASNAVDGNKSTTTPIRQWQVEFSTAPLPAWLEVNLQGSFTIDGFRIFEQTSALRNFLFEVWDTTLNSGAGGWATALNVTANPTTPLTTYKTFTPVTTTKVRLYITAHNNATFLRMFELEVYGLPSSPTWIGGTSAAWNTATNWSTGIVPDQYSNVTIPSGTTFKPIISNTQKMNSLIVDPGATLTVNTGVNLTVDDAITNGGIVTIASNSNLLQGDNTFNNSGDIIIKRNTNALSRLDYTAWSSPVANQNLLNFSPETSATRFYIYSQYSNFYTSVASPSTTEFATATGYLIRMPNTAVTAPATQTFTGTFTGVPNNGRITKSIAFRSGVADDVRGFNLIGNPYPSGLDAAAFVTANTTRIQSTLYFWRKKNGLLGTAYATWINGIGGTASGAGSETPNGTIQVGQGFFVKAKSVNTVTFINAMRLGTPTTQFFKTKKEEKARLWLNLTNTSGVFSQALIGYVIGASSGVDDFDGKYINDSPIALTSNINNEEYTIQGRVFPFDTSDVVTLNFKTDLDGEYTIAIDHFDGVFAKGQDIYLEDSKTGTETDLKTSAYTFTTVAGNYKDRFSLKYQKTLKVDAPVFNENSVQVYKNNGTLYVNSGVVGINNIKVYDIQGRQIAEQKNVKATTVAIKDLKATHQVLIVKITGEDNNVVSKKVIN